MSLIMSGPQSNAPAAMERDINTPSNAGPMATDRCPSERLAQLESAFLTRRCSLESASVARASGRFTDTNGHLFRTAYGMCMRRLRLESVQVGVAQEPVRGMAASRTIDFGGAPVTFGFPPVDNRV
ncbi:hypothetical protein AcV7_003487 [Taiwanofungus camphoratus]|nr:hypothetical protein AcV7_003487 [Antrodia cinnamomea]